jgi:hypothetical protein
MKDLYVNPTKQPRFKNFNELRWAIFLELLGYEYYYENGDFLIDGANGKVITLQVVDNINDLSRVKFDPQEIYNIVVDGNPFFKSTENEYSIAIGKVLTNINNEIINDEDIYWSDLCIKNEFDFSSYMMYWNGMFKDETNRKDFAEDGDACIDILKDKWEKANTISKLINQILISSNATTI